MAERSQRATAEGIQKLRRAINHNGWKQEEIRVELGLQTRQPITQVLAGRPIERATFEELCHLLELPIEEIAATEDELVKQTADITALVQATRAKIHSQVQEQCGTMRVLDMTQPIGLGNIYTNVNILERLSRTKGLKTVELMRDAGLATFDRFLLGEVKQERIPGLEAVERFSKLMILGRPGAGKTTFLKHLAIEFINGNFRADYVPVFVVLKSFAEADEHSLAC